MAPLSLTTTILQHVYKNLQVLGYPAPLEDPSNAWLHTALIEGALGLGKSVLLRHIAYKRAQGELKAILFFC